MNLDSGGRDARPSLLTIVVSRSTLAFLQTE